MKIKDGKIHLDAYESGRWHKPAFTGFRRSMRAKAANYSGIDIVDVSGATVYVAPTSEQIMDAVVQYVSGDLAVLNDKISPDPTHDTCEHGTSRWEDDPCSGCSSKIYE